VNRVISKSSLKIKYVLSTIYKSRKLTVGIIIVSIIVLLGVIGDFIVDFNPRETLKYKMGLPPSFEHPLGTDLMGRDILAQLIASLKQSLLIGTLAGLVGTVIGILVGFTAGYKRGSVDTILTIIMNIFLVIPSWPVMIVIATFVQFLTVPLMSLLLAVFSWSWPARALRSQILTLREREFVYVAKLTNLNDLEIIIEELLPNMLPFIGAGLANAISGAMLAEVGLELIGLGPPNTTTLGIMLYWAQWRGALVLGMWWWLFSPVALLILMFVGFHLINMGLDEIYNPRLRR